MASRTASRSRDFSRYLTVLGVGREPPSLSALSELVRAHLMRCPFESISKVYRCRHLGLRELPSLDEFLDGIEHNHLGGTCYTNNHNLFSLLDELGYDASFCGAAMDAADVHTAIIVSLEARRFLVDVGYAAPFYQPIPIDTPAETRLRWGRDEFVVHGADDDGRVRVDHRRDGAVIHGYTVDPTPRSIDHFDRVIRESLTDSAHFMNTLRLERFFPDHSVSVKNRSLWISRADAFEGRELESHAELLGVIEEHFEIPRGIVESALGYFSGLGA